MNWPMAPSINELQLIQLQIFITSVPVFSDQAKVY